MKPYLDLILQNSSKCLYAIQLMYDQWVSIQIKLTRGLLEVHTNVNRCVTDI